MGKEDLFKIHRKRGKRDWFRLSDLTYSEIRDKMSSSSTSEEGFEQRHSCSSSTFTDTEPAVQNSCLKKLRCCLCQSCCISCSTRPLLLYKLLAGGKAGFWFLFHTFLFFPLYVTGSLSTFSNCKWKKTIWSYSALGCVMLLWMSNVNEENTVDVWSCSLMQLLDELKVGKMFEALLL